jgi:catechol 2,3-dioxygenase-like lactoylglutathione lyase family enzyme
MTIHGLHHLVLRVDDVVEGEAYYSDLFDLDVLFREGVQGDTFGKVPTDAGWEQAIEAGVEPRMSFLGRDQFALALVEEPVGKSPGRLDHLALAIDAADQDAIEERARRFDCETRRSGHSLFVVDRYGVEWELNATSPPPATSLGALDV